jgi:TonB family protein
MSLLLESTVKVSLVIAAGLAVAALLRNRSAAARHWVLAAAMLCAMAMPALELIVPAWGISLPRSAPAALSAPLPGSPLATGAVASDGARLEFAETVAAAPPAKPRPGLSRLLTPAWMLGAGLSLVILAVGLTRLTWLASRARPVQPGTWTRLADEIGRDLSLGRPVQLLQSDHPSLLVTWGLFTPKVILPRAAQSWTEDRAAIVLRHELAHIRRGDWIVQIAGELLRTAYWFNPLLWIACARLRQESEQACDDEVLSSGVEGPDYATHLVELARLLKAESAPRLPAPAIARSSSLERRIRAMLDARLTRTPATRLARFMTAAALFAFTVALAAAQTGPVTLSGSVLDQTGAPVPGAAVVLTNARTQAKFEVTTDESGRFEFVPLPADTYALATTLPGFKKAEDSVTLAGKSVRRDVTLSLGELQETISVRASQLLRMENGTLVTPDGVTVVADVIEVHPKGVLSVSGNVRVSGELSGFQRDLQGCKPSSTGGRVRPPRKIKDVRPIYPPSLRESQTAGKVGLKATIAVDGTVRDVQVVKSMHPDLDNAAIEAVRQWLFDGTLLNCTPTEVTMNVSVDFGIQ